MTNANHTFLTLTTLSDHFTTGTFFSHDLICIVDADEETTRAALVAAGLPEWTPESDNIAEFSVFTNDIVSFFNDKDDWFDENSEDDFSTPWAFAAAAGDATGNDFGGAFTLATLLDHLATGNHPDEAGW